MTVQTIFEHFLGKQVSSVVPVEVGIIDKAALDRVAAQESGK